jgi:ureidoacrylate peracid hydrolase
MITVDGSLITARIPPHEVAMVRDATADLSDEKMHAALEINIPNYASAIVTGTELVHVISSEC